MHLTIYKCEYTSPRAPTVQVNATSSDIGAPSLSTLQSAVSVAASPVAWQSSSHAPEGHWKSQLMSSSSQLPDSREHWGGRCNSILPATEEASVARRRTPSAKKAMFEFFKTAIVYGNEYNEHQVLKCRNRMRILPFNQAEISVCLERVLGALF